MPAQALGLKKYLSGTVGSRTVDKEDATPSLGHSEVLSVKYAPFGAAEGSKGNTSRGPSSGTPKVSPHQVREYRPEVVPPPGC